jgi:hypothetical protein
MHPDAPYFSILLCLTPDDFTRQVESVVTQWVKLTIVIYCSHQNKKYLIQTNLKNTNFEKERYDTINMF